MTFCLLNINFGTIDIVTWMVLFIVTLAYEAFAIWCTLAIIKLKPFSVANLSVMIGITGMVCVIAYAGKDGEINNAIPILAATWVGNYYVMLKEKKKQQNIDKK